MSDKNELSYLAATVAAIQKRIAELAAASGAENFVELNDVPGNYVGAGGLFAKVKATEDGLEFAAGGGGGAPADAKYIVQEVNDDLSAEQSLGALATGILKNTVAAGVGILSIAAVTDIPGLAPTDGPTFDHVHLTSGRVGFPATQVPSADVNTLDDYEEGTWVPVVTAGNGTFTTVSAVGSYVKVGKVVHATFTVTITNKGTAAGAMFVTAPFTSGATYYFQGAGREDSVVGYECSASLAPASNSITVLKYDNTTIIGTGYRIHGTITYFI